MVSNYLIAIGKYSPMIWICEGDIGTNTEYVYIKIDKEVFDLLLSMKSKKQDHFSSRWIKLSI